MDNDGVVVTASAAAEEPTRPLTAFEHFLKWCEQEIRSSEPLTVVFNPPLLEQCTKHWNTIPAEGKVHFEKLAAQDEERYQAALEAQSAASGSPSVVEHVEDKESKKESVKKVRDPDQPKRAVAAVEYFSREHRSKIKAELEGQGKILSKKDLNKVVSERWATFKLLPEGDKYKEMTEKDKQRFKEEMAAHKHRQAMELWSSLRRY